MKTCELVERKNREVALHLSRKCRQGFRVEQQVLASEARRLVVLLNPKRYINETVREKKILNHGRQEKRNVGKKCNKLNRKPTQQAINVPS